MYKDFTKVQNQCVSRQKTQICMCDQDKQN